MYETVKTWISPPQYAQQIRTQLARYLTLVSHTSLGGQITIVTKYENNQNFFQITDTGIGIHPGDLGHIFDRFYCADNARDFEHVTGPGLAIIKRVIELQNGEIEVESDVNIGTKFTVAITVHDQEKPNQTTGNINDDL